MALSNTAVPKYYEAFRQAVMRGEIPVGRYVEMEMHRIDDLIANPGIYYDEDAISSCLIASNFGLSRYSAGTTS